MTPLKLSHIAVASAEIQTVVERLKKLSFRVTESHDVPTEKVKAVMLPLEVSEHLRLEILEPTSPESAIAKFLTKRPQGGLHHLCFEVEGLERWKDLLEKEGFEVLPPGIRKAARGKALFIHPKSMSGVLVELEEIAKGAH